MKIVLGAAGVMALAMLLLIGLPLLAGALAAAFFGEVVGVVTVFLGLIATMSLGFGIAVRLEQGP